jgi:hypothetical protein
LLPPQKNGIAQQLHSDIKTLIAQLYMYMHMYPFLANWAIAALWAFRWAPDWAFSSEGRFPTPLGPSSTLAQSSYACPTCLAKGEHAGAIPELRSGDENKMYS